MQRQCLLVKTQDQKVFFTGLENFPQLIEFSKTVGAEVSVVNPQEPVEVLSLSQLAKSVCDPTYKTNQIHYSVVERKIAHGDGQGRRRQLLAQAQDIRRFITEKFMGGQTVSIGDLSDKYQESGLGQATLRNHLNFVRRKLVMAGHKISKEGVGCYRLTSN